MSIYRDRILPYLIHIDPAGHRLICGDATVSGDVARLLDNVEPGLMVTDPPYGVDYDPAWREKSWRGARSTGKVQADDRSDWREAWALFPGDIAYVWHAGNKADVVAASLQACGFEIRSQIVWAKQHFVISRGHYHGQHEPCWYAVRKGRTEHWAGDRKQTTLWQIANRNAFGGSQDDTSTDHGTQKPVECMRRPIINQTKLDVDVITAAVLSHHLKAADSGEEYKARGWKWCHRRGVGDSGSHYVADPE